MVGLPCFPPTPPPSPQAPAAPQPGSRCAAGGPAHGKSCKRRQDPDFRASRASYVSADQLLQPQRRGAGLKEDRRAGRVVIRRRESHSLERGGGVPLPDEALRQPDGDRTPLQRRALVAVELLSQAWLSWQPDTAFLSAVVALEALLGEPGDSAKKFRIARRVPYFICGWLEGSYAAGGRSACPLLARPLTASGQPGTELKRLMSDVKEGAFTPCTCRRRPRLYPAAHR